MQGTVTLARHLQFSLCMMRAFFLSQLLIAVISALVIRNPEPDLADDLGALVSPASSVSLAEGLEGLISRSSSITIDLKARWSTFGAPLPRVVVNIGAEKDVASVVSLFSNFFIESLWTTDPRLNILLHVTGFVVTTVAYKEGL